MFAKETDLKKMKEVAELLLYIQPDEIPNVPFIVQHPIFESNPVVIPDGDSIRTIDVIRDHAGLAELRERYKKQIEGCTKPFHLYILVRKSYRLCYLRYCKSYLSKADFSHLFADAWVCSENPNQDINVPLSMAVRWFREADKRALMNQEDYDVFSNISEQVRIFRGVAVGRNAKGLSWTQNLRTAEWFAHRFDTDTKQGYVETAVAKKSDILAYFNTRNEDELVVDTKKLKRERMT